MSCGWRAELSRRPLPEDTRHNARRRLNSPSERSVVSSLGLNVSGFAVLGAGAEGVAFQFEVETASSQPEFAGRARDVAAVFT